jgi:hypothetical protein
MIHRFLLYDTLFCTALRDALFYALLGTDTNARLAS